MGKKRADKRAGFGFNSVLNSYISVLDSLVTGPVLEIL